jgi:hypothetical protein
LQKRANLAELRLDDAGFADARATLVGWLVRAFDADANGAGHVRVFALKCVLSSLSAGRLVDKLKCALFGCSMSLLLNYTFVTT